jgi:hypothetical protein
MSYAKQRLAEILRSEQMDGRAVTEAMTEWCNSNEGRQCLAGMCTGEYLKNRLMRAFQAGINARQAWGQKTKLPQGTSR